MTKHIIPSILTDTLDDLKKKLKLVEPFVDTAQIDYVDGYFAPQLSCCEAPIIAELDTPLFLEIHLMMQAPEDDTQSWVETGTGRLIGQIEEMANQKAFVEAISDAGIEVGLGLNLETKLDQLDYSLLDSLDVVLLMAHEVGVSGEKFKPQVLEKVTKLRQEYPRLNIEVDGGINTENAAQIFDAGANWLVVNSAIFEAENPELAIEKFITIAHER